MTDAQRAAEEIFNMLEAAQDEVAAEGWKLKSNRVPIIGADGGLILEVPAVKERIRRITDKFLC